MATEEMENYVYEETRTTIFVQKVLRVVSWCGMPNMWFKDLKGLSPRARKFQNFYFRFLHVLVCFSISLQFSAYWTQHNLIEKQNSDLTLFCGAYLLFYSFVASIGYYRDTVRQVMLKMMVKMKEIHNDRGVEDHFMEQCMFYLRMYGVIWFGVLLFYGLDCLVKSLLNGTTFVTMVTGWPDVHDYGLGAEIARVFIYLKFVMTMMWFSSVYTLSLPVTIGLSHQYSNLGKYFESLNGIFKGEGSQLKKEEEYEKALVVGIKCHTDMLWCVASIQDIFSVLNGGQVILTTLALIMLMYQYTQMERTVSMVISVLVTASSVLLSTGCLMWKAGDVTFEAAGLPTAMYCSGWENCTLKSSRRVRPLLVISMAVAQIPIELKGLGLISFSYDSYVSIVKSSYTVFSVLY